MPATVEREKGLYYNGSRLWMRVNKVPRSTGTSDVVVANRVKRMVDELAESPKTAHWLEADVDLLVLYKHRAAGTLPQLAQQLAAGEKAGADADLDPWVEKWIKEHLPTLGLSDKSLAEYARQVRALIPAKTRFPKSRFTEETLKKVLNRLVEPRTGAPLTGSTRRRYFVAWKLFWRYARKRVPLDVNPFDEPDWQPSNNSPRSMHWDHATTLDVLGRMQGEPAIVMTLIFGSGGELGTEDNGGVLKMQGRHIGPEPKDADELPWIIVPGSKNEYREERTIFVNRWAWAKVKAHAEGIKPHESLWKTIDINGGGKDVREAFYNAQVAAGLVVTPQKSERTGKRLWGGVEGLHTIHDARHTYCYVRMLGDDGEPRQDIKFCSTQLGHADEQMVMRIYNKTNMAQRLRLLELREARKGRAA